MMEGLVVQAHAIKDVLGCNVGIVMHAWSVRS